MTACEICKGACCETFSLGVTQKNADFYLWLKYHGTAVESGIRFDCQCKMLVDGRCSIYEDRPKICRDYQVGSRACLKAIEERRYEQRHEIREAMNGKEKSS